MIIFPRRRVLAGVGACLAVVLLSCAAGFAWFVHLAVRGPQAPGHTDGIVALTGGPERVETALRLLSEGRADRLLLSGIGGGAELSELARRAGVDPLPLASRVTLDRTAATTKGNALATAEWARANAIHSLLVVTAAYHMPRALTELARSLPGVTLYPLPVVQPERLSEAPLRLMAEEYIKFLATTTGLTSVLPEREPTLARPGHAG
jgi:uncharacterized SAM-binding protein YcdF (DUF218 family)